MTSPLLATHHSKTTVIFICMLAALAGLLFGLDIGVISGALKFLQKDFNLNDNQLSWIVSIMMMGAAGGALITSYLSNHLGRKRTLMLGGILFVASSVLCGLAWSANVLLVGRGMLGLAIGMSSFVAPMYLAEISSESIRGAMISIYQLMITMGILLAFLSNLAFSYSGSWRWMLGIIAIPGTLFVFGLIFVPESPRWLLMKERRNEAGQVLHKLTGHHDTVAHQISEIEGRLKIPQRGWRMFWKNRHFRRVAGLGILLQVMQQLTGINAVMYYAPRIFQEMGYDSTAQLVFTAIVGLVNVLATLIAIGLVDKLGRKPILYIGFIMMTVTLGMVSAMLHAGIHDQGKQQFTVIMLLLFIASFAMSAGPVIWVLCPEIQPLKGRDFGMGCCTFTNWTVNALVGYSFLFMLNNIGSAGTFLTYAAFNAVFIVMIFWLIPETKNITLEKIESRLMAGNRLRDIGR